MIVPLRLRHRPGTETVPGAWFLPGNSVDRWLEILSLGDLATTDTRLFLVPRSVADRTPAGLLVVPASADSVTATPAGIACRLVGGRLFVPMEAELYPPVTDAEIRALCPFPVSFLHPAFGLCGFDEGSTLRVWNLLKPPGQTQGDWNAAEPGPPPLPGLRGIVLAEPPSIAEVFGGAQEEIGGTPLVDLPPAPGEPRTDMLANTLRRLGGLFAKGVIGAARLVPRAGSRRTWVNDSEDWAARRLEGIGKELEQARNRELHRLLGMLDTDPEAGLRHAIPLGGLAHRGLAAPGGRLGSRPLDFDMGRLGGRAADHWDVPPDLQEALRRRYRESADREMRLGRHRRAAFIHAELLGDLVSAANVLKQGKCFREAALLYDEHLKNPLEAAQCLAAGGFFDEAIERYVKLNRWLDAADVYGRMGNAAAAEAAVRRVVRERVAQDDILEAARLLDERLHATDEALESLLHAWPSSRQAAVAVAAVFRLLARLGRHEVAMERLARFGRESPPPALVLPLLASLGTAARDYPHEPVRHRAADLSRVLIARRLGQAAVPADETGLLMQFLVCLAPRDRLLARDANRHLSARRDQDLRVRRAAPPVVSDGPPVVVRRFDLPRQIEWLGLRQESQWFFALGVTPKRMTLVRGVWDGQIQSLAWDRSAEAGKNNALVFEPTGESGSALALTTVGAGLLAEKRFPPSDLFFNRACVAGTPAWLDPQHWPVAFGEESVWTAHVAGGRGIVSCHDKRGTLQRTVDVTDDLLAGTERGEHARLCLAVVKNSAAIALGNRLVLVGSGGDSRRFDLPGQATGLAVTLPHTRTGLAIMLEHGAVLHWIGATGLVELERDMAAPLGAFVSGGPLVLVSAGRMLLLDVDSGGVQKVTRADLTVSRPVGISPAASPGQFGVLGADGGMTVYQAPR